MPGTRKRSWRVSERRMLLPGIPMLWKKAVDTICMPTTGQKRETILSPCADAAMREASLAKSDTRGTGKRWLAAKPKVVITVATTRVYFTTETKRSNLRAP